MKQWKILARHKWVEGVTITESAHLEDSTHRKFTATIRGFRNWKIYKGQPSDVLSKKIQSKVIEIRDLIDAGNNEVFYKKGWFL